MCHKLWRTKHILPKNWGESKLSLYLSWWLCIYSGWQTGHNEIWILSYIWPRKSRSIKPQHHWDLNQDVLYILSELGGSIVNGWWATVRTNSEWVNVWFKFDLDGQGQSTIKLAGNFNQGVLCLLSEFGGSGLNRWWVNARTISGLTHTRTHTKRPTWATTIPRGQNWPR